MSRRRKQVLNLRAPSFGRNLSLPHTKARADLMLALPYSKATADRLVRTWYADESKWDRVHRQGWQGMNIVAGLNESIARGQRKAVRS